jgi:hypothetical protein
LASQLTDWYETLLARCRRDGVRPSPESRLRLFVEARQIRIG